MIRDDWDDWNDQGRLEMTWVTGMSRMTRDE